MRLSRIPVNNESNRCLDELAENEFFEVTRFQSPILRGVFGKQIRMNGANVYLKGEKNEVEEYLDDF